MTRGFQNMTAERRREIASKGGKAAAKANAFRRKQTWLPGCAPAKKTRRKKSDERKV